MLYWLNVLDLVIFLEDVVDVVVNVVLQLLGAFFEVVGEVGIGCYLV